MYELECGMTAQCVTSVWTALGPVCSVMAAVGAEPPAASSEEHPCAVGVKPGPTGGSDVQGDIMTERQLRSASVCRVVVVLVDAPCGHCSNVGDGCNHAVSSNIRPRILLGRNSFLSCHLVPKYDLEMANRKVPTAPPPKRPRGNHHPRSEANHHRHHQRAKGNHRHQRSGARGNHHTLPGGARATTTNTNKAANTGSKGNNHQQIGAMAATTTTKGGLMLTTRSFVCVKIEKGSRTPHCPKKRDPRAYMSAYCAKKKQEHQHPRARELDDYTVAWFEVENDERGRTQPP